MRLAWCTGWTVLLGLGSLLLTGCGGSDSQEGAAVVVPGRAVVGSAGGAVRSDDGAEVHFFAAGALRKGHLELRSRGTRQRDVGSRALIGPSMRGRGPSFADAS